MIEYKKLKSEIENSETKLISVLKSHYEFEVEKKFMKAVEANPRFPITIKIPNSRDDVAGKVAESIIIEFFRSHGYMSVFVNQQSMGLICVTINSNEVKGYRPLDE